jgi:CBS domain-containing protein
MLSPVRSPADDRHRRIARDSPMEAELLEIRQHMGRFAPFDRISDELLDSVVEHIEIAYFRADTEVLGIDQPIHHLGYVRSGAVEIYSRSGSLYDRLGEGSIFGHFSLARGQWVRFSARAIEDSLIYFIPEAQFRALCEADSRFADFVELGRPRLETAIEEQRQNNEMMSTRIRKMVTHPPLRIESTASVQETAQRITEAQASAALIVDRSDVDSRFTYIDPQGDPWRVLGIVTDSDFRVRVVARGLAPDTPIGEIAGERFISIQSDESVQEAVLSMLRNGVHHLPVMHRRQPIGIVHLSDIIRYEAKSSVYLVDNIFSRTDVAGLAALAPEVHNTLVRMVADEADSHMIGSALSTVGRSIARRLLELGEQELGPPPVAYCFMTMGSMARDEQSVVSDQDNALVLSDDFEPERHDEYFLALARYVSDGLAACGYTYCKGDIMATNPRWRQPLSVWKEYFRNWIDHPTPEALLHSSVFFDLDTVHGDNRLVEALQDLVAEKAARSRLFLAAMARNALNRTPPLGFFRGFVMEKDGQHRNTIDLKRRGLAPMTDLIRVHALACASRAQNSFARLDDIGRAQLLGPGVEGKLRAAMECIAMSRFRHQALDIEAGRAPDNRVDPDNVPDDERHNLKAAFQVLSNAQKFLKFRYPLPAQTE